MVLVRIFNEDRSWISESWYSPTVNSVATVEGPVVVLTVRPSPTVERPIFSKLLYLFRTSSTAACRSPPLATPAVLAEQNSVLLVVNRHNEPWER